MECRLYQRQLDTNFNSPPTEARMNRRCALLIVPLAMSIPLWALAPSAASAATAVNADQGGATEAQALKVAELKLAALAKEGNPDTPAAENATKKATVKKHARTVKKKRHSKSRHKAQAKIDAGGKVHNIVGRRLSAAEVQGVLSTTRDFSGSDLSGLNLVGEDLSGVKFNRANLKMANLGRADLAECDLELADLTGADLRGASLNQARLRGTRLEGTKMEGALWIDKTICKKGSIGGCIE